MYTSAGRRGGTTCTFPATTHVHAGCNRPLTKSVRCFRPVGASFPLVSASRTTQKCNLSKTPFPVHPHDCAKAPHLKSSEQDFMDQIPSEVKRSTERTVCAVFGSEIHPDDEDFIPASRAVTPCRASRRGGTSHLISLRASSRPYRSCCPALPSSARTSPLPPMHATSDRRATPNVSSPLSSALSSAPDRDQHHEPKVPRVH